MLYDQKLVDGRFDAVAESKLPARPWPWRLKSLEPPFLYDIDPN